MKFEKVLKKKVWGGRQFNKLFNLDLPTEELYGESWEVCSHKNGMSVVLDGEYKGRSLESLTVEFGSKILGEEIVNKFGLKFPLLIKYLDINDKLSVQVHPDDAYALEVEGEFGKFESWYILEASEDATLILGTSNGVTKKTFEKNVNNGEFSELFREVIVKKGDFIDITPGLVHASLRGSITICEIQQNSDTTYRIYDFDRVFKGKKRELHIDKSLDVINFSLIPNITSEGNRSQKMIQNGYIEQLTNNEYYKIDRVLLDGGLYDEKPHNNFLILSIINGSGFIEHDKEKMSISKGDTYFIPANLEILIKGRVEFLKSYI